MPADTADGCPRARVATFSRGIRRIAHLEQFLDARQVVYNPSAKAASDIDYVVGWGQKKLSNQARKFAETHGLPFVYLEDGFLRSIGLGVSGETPLSMIRDDQGVYYDATSPSRLEALLNRTDPQAEQLDDPVLLRRAEQCIQRIVQGRLSKYNHAPVANSALALSSGKRKVLVIDQTVGDMSITQGLVPPDGFRQMLQAALDEHPDAEVLVKTHPDVIAGKKRGYLTAKMDNPRLRLISEVINPIDLLEQVEHVYVATSQLGFEALMVGKPVTCFGVPFYAGWGATEDRAEVPRRSQQRSVREIFAAAYILYPSYVHPDSGKCCEVEDIIEHLERQRYWFERNQGTLYGFGFSRWKRRVVRAYLHAPGNRIEFLGRAARAKRLKLGDDTRLIVWGTREDQALRQLAKRHDVPIWRMEDGFLRSVELGSDFTAPASLVLDTSGVYYDPSRPSDLEQILQTASFTAEELARAAALRRAIISSGVSKYNVDGGGPLMTCPTKRTTILAVGQVDTDASIRLGCPDIPSNDAFLQTIRESHPTAHIIYKPHPDVLSHNRRGRVPQRRAEHFADEVVRDVSLAHCLEAVDEVHVRTSLVGFEALLRGLRVVVYGQPFYCGWGLTEDRKPLPRRSRSRSLDELVAGVLLRYPRYLNTSTRTFTTPEFTIARLQRQRDQLNARPRRRAAWPIRQLQKLLRLCVGV